jgi:hypothetical protein
LKRREDWFEGQLDFDPQRLVFIDETWASTNMARRCGRAPKGERLRASIPHGHWKTTTFIGALRLTGMVAPMVLDGPINGVWFQAYVDQVLVPTLSPGDIVIMDAVTSAPAFAPPLKQRARSCSICRLIVPTSIRSRTHSQSSRRSCEKPLNEQSMASGPPSAQSCQPSRRKSAPISLPPLDMTRIKSNPL